MGPVTCTVLIKLLSVVSKSLISKGSVQPHGDVKKCSHMCFTSPPTNVITRLKCMEHLERFDHFESGFHPSIHVRGSLQIQKI